MLDFTVFEKERGKKGEMGGNGGNGGNGKGKGERVRWCIPRIGRIPLLRGKRCAEDQGESGKGKGE